MYCMKWIARGTLGCKVSLFQIRGVPAVLFIEVSSFEGVLIRGGPHLRGS